MPLAEQYDGRLANELGQTAQVSDRGEKCCPEVLNDRMGLSGSHICPCHWLLEQVMGLRKCGTHSRDESAGRGDWSGINTVV
jgi:hypothetical protein